MAKKKSSRRAPKPRSSTRAGRGARASVRKRVHELTLRAVRDNDLSLQDIPRLAREVVEGAAEGIDKAMPSSQHSVLRQVVHGLTDAAAAAAKAATATSRSAVDRGAHLLRADGKRTAHELRDLEHRLLDSISRAGKSLGAAARAELDVAVREAREAGGKISTAASTARRAADGRLGELGRETADSGARAVRRAVGSILQGAGGFLEGLADAVGSPAPRARPGPRRPSARRS